MTLDELYAACPPVPCRTGCNECCGGVWMLPEEWDRTGRPREDAVSWRGKWFVGMKHDADGALLLECLFAESGGCAVYESRPFVCRLYAATWTLECPHGCHAAPLIPRARARELMEAYLALGDRRAYMERYRALGGMRGRARR